MSIKEIRRHDAPLRTDQGDVRFHYLAGDVELIHTILKPHLQQPAHGHKWATEVHYVMRGRVRVVLEENGSEAFKIFNVGDVFAFPPDSSLHRLENIDPEPAELLSMKFRSDGEDHTADFRNDKVIPMPGWQPVQRRPIFGRQD